MNEEGTQTIQRKMREIKFRGKSRLDGKWVYGDLLRIIRGNKEGFFIAYSGISEDVPLATDDGCDVGYVLGKDIFPVEKDTIGQFTGLHDKNGKEIYEGDIVTMKRTPEGRRMSVTSRHVVTSNSVTDWDFHSLANEILSFSMFNFHEKYSIYNHHVEVIGNIHDNHELAKIYSLNLPEPKSRKPRKKNGIQVEFVVKDNPKKEPYNEDNKIIYEVTQEEMNGAIQQCYSEQLEQRELH